MNERRKFLRMASAVGIPAAAAIVTGGVARADDDNGTELLGSWSTIHTLPFPPGQFREFLSFAEGGVVHETNSFLHTASNLDFSMFGLPKVVNAADGVGSWVRTRNGGIQVVFRKLLFDGSHQNFGDLHVTGTLQIHASSQLSADWHIQAVDLLDKVLVDLGPATSKGGRIG